MKKHASKLCLLLLTAVLALGTLPFSAGATPPDTDIEVIWLEDDHAVDDWEPGEGGKDLLLFGNLDTDLEGLMDFSGEIKVPAMYRHIGSFYEDTAGVMDPKTRKYGIIDKTGKVVIPFEYEYAEGFSDGLARVSKGEGYGYIDRDGKVVIPLIYDRASRFINGAATVMDDDDRMGLIDKSGNFIIPFGTYAIISSDGAGYYAVATSESTEWFGIVDSAGREIIPQNKYRMTGYGSDRFLAVRDGNGKCGLIEYRTGKLVVPCEYDDMEPTMGLGWVEKDGRYGVCDFINGRLVAEPKYTDASVEYDGMIVVAELVQGVERYGYLDKTGREAVPCRYQEVENFSCGLAAVCGDDDLWFYIDKEGNDVFPSLRFSSTGDFTCGYAHVRMAEGGWAYIDREGSILDERPFDDWNSVWDNYGELDVYIVYKNGCCGLMLSDGTEVLSTVYEHIRFLEGYNYRVGIVKRDGSYGFFVNPYARKDIPGQSGSGSGDDDEKVGRSGDDFPWLIVGCVAGGVVLVAVIVVVVVTVLKKKKKAPAPQYQPQYPQQYPPQQYQPQQPQYQPQQYQQPQYPQQYQPQPQQPQYQPQQYQYPPQQQYAPQQQQQYASRQQYQAPQPYAPTQQANAPTDAAVFCPRCGEQLAPGAAFCPKCGAKRG